MRARLLLLLGLFVLARTGAAAAAPPPFARWQLDGGPTLGDHAVIRLGHPQPLADGGLAFDGRADGLVLETNPLAGAAAFTVEVCFRSDPDGPAEQRFFHAEDTGGSRALLETRVRPDGRWALDGFLRSPTARLVLLDREKTHPAGRWTWVALTYSDGMLRTYVNGALELEGAIHFDPMTVGRVSLGVRQNRVSWFKGALREVRVHHTALPAADLQRVE